MKILIALFFTFTLFGTNNDITINEYFDLDDEINSSLEIIENANYSNNGASFYSYDNDLQYYFSNLQGNMARNVKGTCGIIALSMLLSYYDTYYDDNIIPETYDINNVEISTINFHNRHESPGVLCEVVNNSLTITDNDYNNLMYSYRDVSLHAKLLTMNNYLYGTSFSSRSLLLANYLINVANITMFNLYGLDYGNYFTTYYPSSTHENYSTLVKNYIIDKVSNGCPVLVGATNTSLSNHHAFVIYGYDSTSSSFIANMGWGYGNSNVYLNDSSFYRLFKSALTISFDQNHSHSNNYIFRSSFGDQYNYSCCGCGYTTHSHYYTYAYAQNTRYKHRAYCNCGNSFLEVHLFDLYGVCECCGYVLHYYLYYEEPKYVFN